MDWSTSSVSRMVTKQAMSKEETFQDLSLNPPSGKQDLWRWLYTELRGAILDGRLKPGARMPSTRSLGKQYSLSRGTVVAAFDQLQAEGYTRTEVGSGTYVASGVPDGFLSATRKPAALALPTSKAAFSKRAHQFLKDVEVLPASRSIGKAFRAYEPAIDLFPTDLWARVASRVLRRAPRSLYGHGNAAGYQPLRRAIAEYVGASRGVRCSPEQIIVTSGTQQALDLIGRFLLDPGDQVWMEDPGYSGALQTLRATGARIVPVPVDGDGLIVKAGRKLAPKAKLAYVTPANQFPMGVTMSADRRLELLRWAASANAWIIEDDYDAEYRYSGHPVAALQALDSSGCVIYVGTFTKMLFNALRLGFMVLPERLVDAVRISPQLRRPPSAYARSSHPRGVHHRRPLRPSSSAACAKSMRNASTFSKLLQTNTSVECSTWCTQARAYAHSAGSKHGSPIATRRSKRGSSGSK